MKKRMNAIKKYVSNNFSVTFTRQEKIRRKANDFEDKLIKHYPTIQILPIPDNLGPNIPRIVFESAHGFSQINISETNISLNVTYSDDYQDDITKGEKYLRERLGLVFELLNLAQIEGPYFSGLVTKLQIFYPTTDEKILSKVRKSFQLQVPVKDLYDLEIKTVQTLENKFFNNINVRNFRLWNVNDPLNNPKLKKSEANIRGIEVIADFNDRYSYNEKNNYVTSEKIACKILDKGIQTIEQFSRKLIEG